MNRKRRKTAVRGAKRGTGERTLGWIMRALLAFYLFVTPLLLYTRNTEYGYTKVVFTFVVVSLLLALWGLRGWLRGGLSLRLPPLAWPALALLLAGALSLFNATSAGTGLQSLAVLLYFAFLYLLIGNLAEDRRTVLLLLSMAALAVFGTGLYGILQYHGLLPGRTGSLGTGAMISSMGNQNYLAGFLSYLLIPGTWLLIQVRRWWLRGLVAICLGVGLYALVLTKTTGAFLGLGAALAFLLLAWLLHALRGGRFALVAAGAVAAGLLVLVYVPVEPLVGMRGTDWDGVVVDEGPAQRTGFRYGGRLVAGASGNGLELNGESAYVTLPAQSAPTFAAGSFSGALWARLEDTGEIQTLVGRNRQRSGFFQGWRLIYRGDSNGKRTDFTIGDGDNRFALRLERDIADGQWHHLAWRVDRASDQAALFHNGELVDQRAVTFQNVDSDRPLTVGRRSHSARWYLKGALDEVRLWGRALSDEEIDALAKREAPASLSDGLALAWGFDAGPLALQLAYVPARLGDLWQRNADRTRAWDWWVGFEMAKARPLLGVGLGNYKVDFLDYKGDFLQTERGAAYDFYIRRAAQAHNDYVQAVAEMGLLGLAAVLFLLGTLLWSARRGLRQEGGARWAHAAMLAGVVAYLAHALVSFPAHLPASSLALVLLLGLAHSRALYPDVRALVLCGWALRATVVVVVVLGVSVSALALRDWQANLHLDRGNALMQRGLHNLARNEYERSLALDFQPAEVLYRLGDLNRTLGNPEAAARYFERSLGSFVVEETFLFLTALELQNENFDAARAHVRRLLRMQPNPETLREAENLRGVIEVRAGNVEEGIAVLTPLLERYPDFEKLYLSLGEAMIARYESSGDAEHRRRALDYYREGMAVVERKLERLQARWADIEERVGRGEAVSGQEGNSVRNSIDYLNQVRDEIEKVLDQLQP